MDALRPDRAIVRWLATLPGTAAPYRLPIYCTCTVAALAITWLLGKDLAWDTYHYHLYAGFSALHDRFAQDYFAAGPQAYFNPYAYLPFYLLVRLGLSALAIGALLTLWHSVILWLTFELAVAACPAATAPTRAMMGLCAVALALLNPILLQQFGSSFADVTTAELVLGGWLLLVRGMCVPRTATVLGAAALLGAATALKLTNATHALAGAALLVFLRSTARDRIRWGVGYFAALGATFAIIAAPWAYRLAQIFGNPFFPMFNRVFRSPEFTTEPLRSLRFVPANLAEALWRPFAMLDPTPMVHDELRAPEERYAVVLILLCLLMLGAAWKRVVHPRSPVAAAPPQGTPRVVAALGCALVLDWTLWLMTSGNSRYFIPMACVTAVLIPMLLSSLAGPRPRLWVTLVAALAVLQLYQTCMSPGLRWTPLPWDSGPWIRVDVPPRLQREPALYLSMDTLSNSFLAAYVAPGAGFINFTGSYAIGPSGANGQRVEELIQRYSPRLRVLTAGARLYSDVRHLPNAPDVNGALARFGLRVDDPARCDTIALSPAVDVQLAPVQHLLTCGVVPDSSYQQELSAHQGQADLILDRLEDACPALLRPRRPVTEYRNHRWLRNYVYTDVLAWVSLGWVKIYNPVSGDGPIFVGSERSWLESPQRVVCGRRGGHDFAYLAATAR